MSNQGVAEWCDVLAPRMVKLEELNRVPERCSNTLRRDMEGLAPMCSKDSTAPSISATYRTIPLTYGKEAIVDATDYEWLSKRRCYAVEKSGRWYAAVVQYRGKHLQHQPTQSIGMHRLILNAPPGFQVDHINGDGLDNRRSNLRLATYSQNQANRHTRIFTNTSGYRGVSFKKQDRRWRAQITVEGRYQHLGYFNTPEEAARAYDRAFYEAFGEYATLNFPAELDRPGDGPE